MDGWFGRWVGEWMVSRVGFDECAVWWVGG